MTHPLISQLSPLMDEDIDSLRAIVADWVSKAGTDLERAVLRYFGAELGAVQRRIRHRAEPPTQEEIEIALTAVMALMNRRVVGEQRVQGAPSAQGAPVFSEQRHLFGEAVLFSRTDGAGRRGATGGPSFS